MWGTSQRVQNVQNVVQLSLFLNLGVLGQVSPQLQMGGSWIYVVQLGLCVRVQLLCSSISQLGLYQSQGCLVKCVLIILNLDGWVGTEHTSRQPSV